MAEILASLDDINAELPSDDAQPVVVADDDNTALLQISTARVVRGYLSRVIDNATLLSWQTPDSTPEIISVAAGKLIAAQLFFNKTAETSIVIDADSFAQKRYNEGMQILNDIVAGIVDIPTVIITSTESLSTADFFPVDATDRSFTKSQVFN